MFSREVRDQFTMIFQTTPTFSSSQLECFGLGKFIVYKNKENVHYTEYSRITPKRIASGGINLRSLAPGQHSSDEQPLATVCPICPARQSNLVSQTSITISLTTVRTCLRINCVDFFYLFRARTTFFYKKMQQIFILNDVKSSN